MTAASLKPSGNITDTITAMRGRPDLQAAADRIKEQRKQAAINERLAKRIRLYPEILLRAANNNKPVGAFRLYVIAKSFDHGSGFIPAKQFRQYLASLGIARPTFYRWIDQALALGIIEYNGKTYRLAAWEIAAIRAGCPELMRPVTMPLGWLIGKGWMGRVWSAWLKHFEGPKARATLEALTGCPARTQRHYEAQAGVYNQANYADLGDPASDPGNAWAHDPENGVYSRGGRMRKRLPNTRLLPEGITLAPKGRTKQRNRKLQALYIEDSSPEFTGRQYCKDDKQVKTATKQGGRLDARTRPNVLWLFRSLVSGAGVYEPVYL